MPIKHRALWFVYKVETHMKEPMSDKHIKEVKKDKV